MRPKFTEAAWKQYGEWEAGDRKGLERVRKVVASALRTPSEGIGKPERLKGDLKRLLVAPRITDEHRLVYKPEGDTLLIIQCRYHY